MSVECIKSLNKAIIFFYECKYDTISYAIKGFFGGGILMYILCKYWFVCFIVYSIGFKAILQVPICIKWCISCFLHRPWEMSFSHGTFSCDGWRRCFAFLFHCPLSVGDPAGMESLLEETRLNWAAVLLDTRIIFLQKLSDRSEVRFRCGAVSLHDRSV